jgi:hypothetical protein
MIAKAVTTVLQKQTEESISLHWKTDYDGNVNDVSSEDDNIRQEDPKATSLETTDKEATINYAIHEDSEVKINRSLESQSQLGTSTQISNSPTYVVLRTSRRHKKPPVTKKDGFLW